MSPDDDRLGFAASATIRVLIQAHQALSDAGGSLELLSPQPGVARSLSLLGVDQVIAIRSGNVTGDHPAT